ncbi:TRAP transporter small permease subunit [Stappia sp. GBMRC 2046]|uniref:TRAP transporter small permease protein n=1 Tax=Stappia sediminis TaxID=2692190 RepID=A0A7X3S8U5_9HYPH|nr:TRAP transporter small permease [Stappia sediminis]MXN66182.1 TRAP transporter small permease subunit [Stappia sediminis]
MFRIIDRLSAALGQFAAWAYFATALMLGYEVFMRYVFIAPTIWAEELSRLFLVWGTFAGAAILVHRRQHIAITVLTDALPPRLKHLQQVVVLLFIAFIAAVTVWYAFDIAADSFTRGRTTGSMLDVPAWWNEAAIPVCFTLLSLQALVEALRVAFEGPADTPPETTESGSHA